MKIYAADTWTDEELLEQISDAGRRSLMIPAADTKRLLLETFSEVLDFPEDYGVDFDALNDSLHDLADAISEGGREPVTILWQVPATLRADRSFGLFCEVLQDAEKYAGKDLSVVAICL